MSVAFWKKDDDPFEDPTFVFDLVTEESRSGDYEWTDKSIELGAKVSDFGAKMPEKFTVSGLISATSIGSSTEQSAQRIIDAEERIRKLADERQLVTIVMGYWVGDRVIKSIRSSCTNDIGEAMEISIEMTNVVLPEPDWVDIPPSRLKTRKLRRRSRSKKGGTETGKTPSGKTTTKSRAWKLLHGQNPFTRK